MGGTLGVAPAPRDLAHAFMSSPRITYQPALDGQRAQAVERRLVGDSRLTHLRSGRDRAGHSTPPQMGVLLAPGRATP